MRVQGWDLLLRAYLTAFTAEDAVLLVMLTKPFHGASDFDAQMRVRRGGGRAAGWRSRD